MNKLILLKEVVGLEYSHRLLLLGKKLMKMGISCINLSYNRMDAFEKRHHITLTPQHKVKKRDIKNLIKEGASL